MTSTDEDTPPYNLTGALVFTAYVIAALLLTAFLTGSLYTAYRHHLRKSDHKLENRLQLFSALSILSFSTLSYNMSNYLMISYRDWAISHGYELPQRLFGAKSVFGSGSHEERVPMYIWSWLTSSTLFQDFASTICGNSARFWWTQQALLVTVAWSDFFSIEGQALHHTYPQSWPLSLTACRSKTQGSSSMGVRVHQSNLTGVFRAESVFLGYASDARAES